MAINHELSGDIAIALLTGRKRDPKELENLKEVVVQVHATLQRLKAECRRREFLFDCGSEKENGS
jgi:hypothetical protein